jgi:hypothetical protein
MNLHGMIHGRAPVAQLDRAPDFESVGRRFESCRARQHFRIPFRNLSHRSSVQLHQRPSKSVNFRVADRVAARFAWQQMMRCGGGICDGEATTRDTQGRKDAAERSHLIVLPESQRECSRCQRARARNRRATPAGVARIHAGTNSRCLQPAVVAHITSISQQ